VERGRLIETNYKSKFKSVKTCEVFETELVLTPFRAACRGTLRPSIEAKIPPFRLELS
jgi:hypothetical protein